MCIYTFAFWATEHPGGRGRDGPRLSGRAAPRTDPSVLVHRLFSRGNGRESRGLFGGPRQPNGRSEATEAGSRAARSIRGRRQDGPRPWPLRAAPSPRSGGWAERDDRQMGPAGLVSDHEIHRSSRPPSRRPSSLGRRERIPCSGLDSGPIARGPGARQTLERRRATERLMGPRAVVPGKVRDDLGLHRRAAEGHGDQPQALLFQRSPEPLDDRDRTALADRAETRPDTMRAAPAPVASPKLRSLVGHGVLRRSTRGARGSIKHRSDFGGVGLVAKHAVCDDEPREVIEHRGDPPAEGPALGQGERQPRDPDGLGTMPLLLHTG